MPTPSQLPSKTEQRIIRQCMEAILFEQLLPYHESDIQEGWKLFYVKGANRVYQCLGKRSAFDRVRLQGMPLISKKEGVQAIPTLMEIVEDAPLTSEQRHALLHELQQTALLSEWNDMYITKAQSRRGLSYEQLESELSEGHPYHPCFKARTGFTLSDHQAYGNEKGEAFALIWLGVKKEDVATYYPEEEHSFLQRELGYGTWSKIVKALCKAGGQLTDYRLMPVHPWQWKRLKKELVQEAQENKEILYLGPLGQFYRGSQSLRTLINRDSPEKAHIKLPLHVMNTSSIRTIQPESVAAAPQLSTWLETIVEQDAFLASNYDVRILKEYAGAAYEPKNQPKINCELNILYRESVAGRLCEGEQAIPFNALSLQEEDGNLFIAPSIDQYGLEVWLEQLIEISVIPIIHLCAEHGIALEAHAQNMILVLENGWPKAVMLRDFHESMEYYEPWIRNKEAIPPFGDLHAAFENGHEDEYYWMSSEEALRELVMDTLFVYHLTELSWQVEQNQRFTEAQFWSIVNRCLSRYFEKNHVAKSRFDSLGFDADIIKTESLFKKKWANEKESSHQIKNVLKREANHVYR